MVKACLVDVYETILDPDFLAREQALAAFAGVRADDWLAEWLKTRTERDRGKLSVADSFARTLQALGIDRAAAELGRARGLGVGDQVGAVLLLL